MFKKITLCSTFPWLLTIGGVIGLVASFILSYDTLEISHNPHYIPSCNLNPVLSCGSVINTTGDTIFKLPYPYFGIAAFAVLLMIGISLLAGAKFKHWFWLGYQAVVTLGLLGAYYLLAKSIFKIHALCPFCLTVDVVTTAVFWYSTLYLIDNKHLRLNHSSKAYRWIRRHHLDLLILWFLIITAYILHHFWYYYGKHFF